MTAFVTTGVVCVTVLVLLYEQKTTLLMSDENVSATETLRTFIYTTILERTFRLVTQTHIPPLLPLNILANEAKVDVPLIYT